MVFLILTLSLAAPMAAQTADQPFCVNAMGCDDIWLAIKAARASADADAREIAAHLEGLNKTKSAMKPGERRLASD